MIASGGEGLSLRVSVVPPLSQGVESSGFNGSRSEILPLTAGVGSKCMASGQGEPVRSR